MSENGEPEGTFSIFFAEGEVLAKQEQYGKAIDSFSKALDFQPEDKSCLVARSKCYLLLGDTTSALRDAEDSLKENKTYHKGLAQKAEVLYSMGNFEHSLMYFHRGYKIRPELDVFALGIQKCQEAINNSIGSPAACKLEKKGDLSYFHQQDSIGKKSKKKLIKPQAATQQQKKERKPVASEKTIKELLEELYADREYLDQLLADPKLVIGRKDHSIYDTVEDTLIYLDSKTEFWRQEKPIYARRRERELRKYKPPPTKPITVRVKAGPINQKYMLKSLEEVDNLLACGNAEDSLKQAEKLMKKVQDLTERDLPNKQEFIASLHSCIGNAHLELGDAEAALENHLIDLELAKELCITEIRSRALDNIGRVYAVMGRFDKASEYWKKKLPLISSPEESAWLNHELGRCQMELGGFSEAIELGKISLSAATESYDQMWQLNASMLIAQANSRLGKVEEAVEYFEKAMGLAKLLEDTQTLAAISKAMEEVAGKVAGDGAEGIASETSKSISGVAGSELVSDVSKKGGDKIEGSGIVSEASGVKTEGSGVSGVKTEGSGASGVKTEGSGVSGVKTEGSGLSGVKTEGSGVSGVKTEGSGTSGVKTEGSGISGVKTEGSGASGVKTEGSGISGVKTEGSGASGVKTEGSGVKTEGSGSGVKTEGSEASGVKSSVSGVKTEGSGASGVKTEGSGVSGVRTEGSGVKTEGSEASGGKSSVSGVKTEGSGLASEASGVKSSVAESDVKN